VRFAPLPPKATPADAMRAVFDDDTVIVNSATGVASSPTTNVAGASAFPSIIDIGATAVMVGGRFGPAPTLNVRVTVGFCAPPSLTVTVICALPAASGRNCSMPVADGLL
jgi:hypothetical protein